jgi:hypothetical protein
MEGWKHFLECRKLLAFGKKYYAFRIESAYFKFES